MALLVILAPTRYYTVRLVQIIGQVSFTTTYNGYFGLCSL